MYASYRNDVVDPSQCSVAQAGEDKASFFMLRAEAHALAEIMGKIPMCSCNLE